jgi:hypothetical protein
MVKPQFRNRHIQIYLHNEDDKPRWQAIADKAGVSLSRLIIEAMEDFIIRKNLPHEIGSEKLREENTQLRVEVKKQSQKITKLEEDIRTLRLRLASKISNPKIATIIRLLLLKVTHKDFLEAMKETTIEELKFLERAGLVEETKYGWRVKK